MKHSDVKVGDVLVLRGVDADGHHYTWLIDRAEIIGDPERGPGGWHVMVRLDDGRECNVSTRRLDGPWDAHAARESGRLRFRDDNRAAAERLAPALASLRAAGVRADSGAWPRDADGAEDFYARMYVPEALLPKVLAAIIGAAEDA